MITSRHRWAFWFGIVAVSSGVALHLPMYISTRHMHYHMDGMPMEPTMQAGMVLIVTGLALSVYSLVPRGAAENALRAARLQVAALDEAPIRRSHVALLLVNGARTRDEAVAWVGRCLTSRCSPEWPRATPVPPPSSYAVIRLGCTAWR